MSDSHLHDELGEIDLLEGAESYVNSVMSSQTVLSSPVTEIFSKRKRHLSVPTIQDSAKKLRGICSDSSDLTDGLERSDELVEITELPENVGQGQGRKVITAKKKLYKPQKKGGETICTAASVHVDADVSVKDMISQMNNTMQTLFASLSDKMKQMENNIESKLVHKFNQQIDKRVNSESKKLKKEMESQLSDLRTDLCDDIAEINARLNSLSENFESSHSGGQFRPDGKFRNMEKNIIIRNLPYTSDEDLRGKVYGLLRDGLKLAEVVIDNVERKESRVESSPGVIVVTLGSQEDKRNILRVKANLNKSDRFKRVFIHPDLPKRERQLAANFRKVVNAVQNSEVKLFVKGSRVLSSRRSAVEEDVSARDRSHSRGRDSRVLSSRRPSAEEDVSSRDRSQSRGRGSRDRQTSTQYSEDEYMDTNTFNSGQSDSYQNRRSRDDRKFSAHGMRGNQRNVHNSVNFDQDLSSNDGRPSASGRSSRKPPADRSGHSNRGRHFSGDRHVEQHGRSTVGGQSRQSNDIHRSDRSQQPRDSYHGYSRNDFNSRSYSK